MKTFWLFLTAAAATTLSTAAPAGVAPKPLFRDPVFDGAADVSIIYDRGTKLWKMFYTNRRATMRLPDHDDVAWVHATKIGIATSRDGLKWTYAGTADLPQQCTDVTSWAPELFYENGVYHMWLTVVPGIFHRWGAPGAKAHIVHLTSSDLAQWNCEKAVDLNAGRIIDASVLKIGDRYRLWYKDEGAGSRIMAADSTNLEDWTKVSDEPVSQTRGEGPKAFYFQGYYWLIADAWKGLMVLRSTDAKNWEQQKGFLLGESGEQRTDRAPGQHPDVVVNGDKAYIYYFVHQKNEPEAQSDPYWNQRTVIQVAELKNERGILSVNREKRIRQPLQAPGS